MLVGVSIDGYQGNEAYTSLTIGGVAANLIQEQNAASGGRPVALYELDVSSGTSADIVVTFTGTQTKCYSMGIGVWTIEGGTLFSTVGSTANPGAGNISVSSGGTVIAIMTEGNAAATYAWANLTENFDNQVRASRQAFSGASKNLSSATTQAISATSSGGSQFAMLAASFAPAGGYGTNGFQLDYADTGYFGKDVATAHTAIGATYRATAVSTANASSYTFSSQAIGTADANRYVIVAVHLQRSNTSEIVNSLSVGGVSATLISSGTSNTANRSLVDFWKAAVPTGTTADVVVTLSGTADRCAISVWSCIGNVQKLQSVIAAPSDASTNALLTTTQVPDNGFALSGVAWQSSSGGTDNQATFANTTERVDATFGEVDASYAAASADFTSASVLGISCTSQLSGGSVYYAVMNTTSFVPAGMNSYIANNFTTTDQLEDTPTDSVDDGIGNFATLNPNDNGGGVLSQGNRYFTTASDKSIRATISGTEKYQIECFGINEMMFGLANAACPLTGGNHYKNANSFMYYGYNGSKINTSFSSYGSASTTDSTYVGMTYDPSNGDLRFYLNGTDQGTAFTMDTSVEWYPYIFGGSASQYLLMNFGQTAFEHPISGFTPLATQNLTAPTIADGSQYFNTVLYTGNGTAIGSGGNAITGVGFQPDFVWIKGRDTTFSHQLYDVIRGPEKPLNSNNTGAEGSNTEVLTAFTSDGFTVGSNSGVNQNTKTYVGWCWKAGGSASSNSEGSITTSVSANTTSGFSIISYTGNATAGATLGLSLIHI